MTAGSLLSFPQLPGILEIFAATSNLPIAIMSGSSPRRPAATASPARWCHPVGHGEVSPGKVLSFLAGKMLMRILSGEDGSKFEPRIPNGPIIFMQLGRLRVRANLPR